jgi:hypothetical protein
MHSTISRAAPYCPTAHRARAALPAIAPSPESAAIGRKLVDAVVTAHRDWSALRRHLLSIRGKRIGAASDDERDNRHALLLGKRTTPTTHTATAARTRRRVIAWLLGYRVRNKRTMIKSGAGRRRSLSEPRAPACRVEARRRNQVDRASAGRRSPGRFPSPTGWVQAEYRAIAFRDTSSSLARSSCHLWTCGLRRGSGSSQASPRVRRWKDGCRS